MKVLVAGATGLIGSSICARLASEGHQVIGVSRGRPKSALAPTEFVPLDIARAVEPEDWLPHLRGVDVVVNCAGVLQDSAREKTREIHRDAALALFMACERADVRRVIHFSAIGVDRAQPSSFSTTKLEGDEALMARDLDWVILRPSVVLGRPVYGASALVRGLAALPILPSMPGTGRLQVVQLDDIVSTVSFFLDADAPSGVAIELAGPETMTMDEVAGVYRKWMGWRPAKLLRLPDWAASMLYRLGDFASLFGWRPPMRTNAAKEITRGAVGDPSRWTALTGIRPRSLAAALAAQPATVQDKWFAKLYFVKPVMFVILPIFWIGTGVVSLTIGWGTGVGLMQSTGAGVLSGPAVVAGALADMVAGALIAWRPTARLGLHAAILISLFYLITGSILRPDLWYEPLGPLLKIFPILACHFAALAILDER
ncbi:SDR family oxidoreductase [Pseudaminobacter sp. 19-2017]|uniref:SDR family oxidoreductase n=1 Tax=Pseudaminobacter soli (ex Zhang et al. 2022) TaxID=2831468 RepID=A0A942E597_9HYPH|nr:SDR family oxidoreductase [Pseudaminobacter soli]MBS3651398.1 SDR family oxidoreductase [Pseudaminobacter soli]